jgi:hypothetical protein
MDGAVHGRPMTNADEDNDRRRLAEETDNRDKLKQKKNLKESQSTYLLHAQTRQQTE